MAKSFISEVAEKKNLQTFIDETRSRFAAIFWPALLSKKYTKDLKYETLVGSRKAGVAANVTAYNVSAPLHSRDVLQKLTGNIPSMRGKRSMDENELMEYIRLSDSSNPDQKRLLDLIYDDVAWASVAPHKRIDWFLTRMLSTGKIDLNTTTNAAGIVTQTVVDFNMPEANKTGTTGEIWSNAAGATPLTDLKKSFFEPAADMGIVGGVIRMHPSKVWQMLATNEVKTALGLLTNGKVTSANIELGTLNQWLAANNYPQIRPFNASIGIEKDGKVTYTNPWEVNNVSYTPDGQIGVLNIAPVVEKERPQPQVAYADYLDNLVKKFSEVDPVTEFTAFEMNAFPSFDTVDQAFLLNTANKGAFA
jgi:hypothetical protein